MATEPARKGAKIDIAGLRKVFETPRGTVEAIQTINLDIKPGEFFMLTVTNLLILGCTLGLGAAWVVTRTMRFFISRVELETPSRLDWAMQAPRGKVGVTGEAVGDALDLGVGLGF